MKKIILSIFIFVLAIPIALAYEEVSLDAEELNVLKVPKSPVLEYEKEHKENYSNSRYENYFDAEDDVFESKAGKTFSKFVNDVVINKKLNQKLSGYENMYLEKDE